MLFPALAVALSRMAMTVKMLRSSILDEMNKDYIRTAFSRGRTRVDALKKHALRNAMIPVIAFLAVTAAELVAGSIVVEQVFAVPGIGRLLLASIGSRDFPVAQAVVVLLAVWVVVVNFIGGHPVPVYGPTGQNPITPGACPKRDKTQRGGKECASGKRRKSAEESPAESGGGKKAPSQFLFAHRRRDCGRHGGAHFSGLCLDPL